MCTAGKAMIDGLQQLAGRLQASRIPGLLGASDVLAWEISGRPVLTFQGDALRMERAMGLIGGGANYRNHHSDLDIDLQRVCGLEAGHDKSGRSIESTVGQTMSEPDAHVTEMLEGLERAAGAALGLKNEQAVIVTVAPEEAEPWTPGQDKTPYYSAKKKKTLQGAEPAGYKRLGTYEKDDLPDGWEKRAPDWIDPCSVAPTVALAQGPIAAKVGDKGDVFLVTHSLQVGTRTTTENADAVKACGGLLYPSLALGIIPANRFGLLTLFGRAHLALGAVKPFKSRGRYPVVLYSSDAWTGTTRTFQRAGFELFDELTCRKQIGYGENHFWVLGPEVAQGAGPGAERPVTIIGSTSRLASAMRRRAKMWPRTATQQNLDRPFEYPYIEAKSAGVVGWACFPLAICADYETKICKAWLRRAGFGGTLISIPDQDQDKLKALNKDLTLWNYSWLLRDRALGWADSHGGIANLPVA